MDEDELIETPDETESFFEEGLEDISDLVNFGAMDIAESSDASGAYFSATQTTEYESETVTIVIPEATYDDDVYSEESDEEDTDLEIPDDVETYSDENDYENLNVATVATVGAVSAGERVIVLVKDGVPTVIGAEGWGDGIEADIADAAAVAAEAQEVADATNQHFFADTNGVHVTETEEDATTGHNILINSLGILLRKATNYLTSITASAIAFYDGAGTAASNIVAQFGAALARIGYVAGSHIDISSTGIELTAVSGNTTTTATMTAGTGYTKAGAYAHANTFSIVVDGGAEIVLATPESDPTLGEVDINRLWAGSAFFGTAEASSLKVGVTSGSVPYDPVRMTQDSNGNLDINTPISATSFSGAGSSLTGLNGSNISSGTVAAARIANLPASKITSGTFDASRLPLATLDNQGAISAEMFRRLYYVNVGSGTTPVLTVMTSNDNGAQWQMGINPTSGAVNVRAYNGSTWSAWKTLATVSWS